MKDYIINDITFRREEEYISVFSKVGEIDRIPIMVPSMINREEVFQKICTDYYNTSSITKIDREQNVNKQILVNDEVKMSPELKGAYELLKGVSPKCQLLGEYAGIDEDGNESMGIFINTPQGFNFATLIRYKDGVIKLLNMNGEPLSFI